MSSFVEDDIEIPSFFICPISLEMMKDPVTVSTGITYDRDSIEKWLLSGKNNTCPVTKQILPSKAADLIPNHTLRRLIQSWCTLNASHGIQRLPTPKPPVTKREISKLLKEAKCDQHSLMKCLKELKSIASVSEANRRCIESAGAVDFLASLIKRGAMCDREEFVPTTVSDEALIVLHHLQLSEAGFRSLTAGNSTFIESLTRVMQRGSFESRSYANFILKSAFEVAEPVQLMSLSPNVLVQCVQLLKDKISWKASKAALQGLLNVVAWGRNKIKAVEAGAVPVLIDLLLDLQEKRACEMILTLLDQLCQCAEGRAELLKHGAGLAVVSKKILRVSNVATARGVRVLHSIAKFSATSSVLEEMLRIGAVTKLCLVIQVDCGTKAKEKAREILKLHARAWKNSPCGPKSLFYLE